MIRRSVASAVREVESGDGRLVARCRYPSDLPVLEGHFPTYRVVPGVYGLELALHLLDRTGSSISMPCRILKAKYARPTLEERPFTVEITEAPQDDGTSKVKVFLREETEERALLSRFTLLSRLERRGGGEA